MRKDIAGPEGASSMPTWDTLEEMVRQRHRGSSQHILEEEVTELLGRRKSERRAVVDAKAGYRNGYGKPRRLAMSSGTIKLLRPRVRGLEGAVRESGAAAVCQTDEGGGGVDS